MSSLSDYTLLFYLFGGIIFSCIGIFFSKNKDSISRKYRRIDFIVSLLLLILMTIFELVALINGRSGSIDMLSVVILTLLFLFSGTWNLIYKKEINSDMSYKFGVSFFICGWIGIFYILAELFR